MAQAVYDEHPLQKYLNELGEASKLMPGGSTDFLAHDDEFDALNDEHTAALREPSWILDVFEILSNLFTTRFSQQPSPFIERFKYDVISSSLLSSSLSASRRPSSPCIPGQLRSKSRSRSLDYNQPPPLQDANNKTNQHPDVTTHYNHGLLGLAVAAFEGTQRHDMAPTMQSLEELISASDIWDSVVHDAIHQLENEERSVFYGPTTPSSPLSHLRVALNSSLHTTQSQCDNIRQLLSALTSPSELPQLSEMYAPPSPTKASYDLEPSSPRPLSLSTSTSQSSSRQRTVAGGYNKRSTWNGSYASLAIAGSPPMPSRRREKRRSDLSTILKSSLSSTKSFSAPTTPSTAGATLAGVKEEDSDVEPEDEASSSYIPFGVAALDLRRKRQSAGMEALGMSSKRSSQSMMASGSHFTSPHTNRHPLSISALNLALQAALSSKRYTCSYLLALRFLDEEDEAYWEDVRSVMGLLASTFADASARLSESLDEAEARRVKDQTPTPETQSRRTSYNPEDILSEGLYKSSASSSAGPSTPTFAPMPSQLSRFALHVEAISTALTDAREYLMQTVTTLREAPPNTQVPHPSPDDPQGLAGLASLQSYERLRRELGLALRECERGRERLLDIVSPHKRAEDQEELPALGQDHGSDSDKAESSFQIDDENHVMSLDLAILSPDNGEQDTAGLSLDDATAHLLLSTSAQHLPPIGAEEVFESDSGSMPVFARDRPKLSREERIKLMKERRESSGGKLGVGLGMSVDGGESGVEKWGPTGDVVQELKDVIWKVGEKRRKMVAPDTTADAQSPPPPPPTTSIPMQTEFQIESS
ncbi:Myosin-binding domain-containing protein [Pleurotus pulmonarius]